MKTWIWVVIGVVVLIVIVIFVNKSKEDKNELSTEDLLLSQQFQQSNVNQSSSPAAQIINSITGLVTSFTGGQSVFSQNQSSGGGFGSSPATDQS